MPKKVVCFGPGPAYKGGLANYNSSLARAFHAIEGVDVSIVSWSEQYPSIVPRDFKDRVSQKGQLEGTSIPCDYLTNYNNPITWKSTADHILGMEPDLVVFQWSIALQGLPLGRIIRRIKKKSSIQVVVDLHFVIQKEQSRLDLAFTRMGVSLADTYVVHSLKTFEELKTLYPSRKFHFTRTGDRSKDDAVQTVLGLYHPIYDLFQPQPDFDIEAFKLAHGLQKHVFLFFGFIRKYKGLHQVIESFARFASDREDVSLLICGESFWNTLDENSLVTRIKKGLFKLAKKVFLGGGEDEKDYRPLDLVDQLGIRDKVVVFNQFIPNEDVHKYFQVSDCVVLYYLTATPSGIESLSYNFDLPILATRVGHFPETITDGKNGYLAEAEDLGSMALTMKRFLENPIPTSNVASYKDQLSWDHYARVILTD